VRTVPIRVAATIALAAALIASIAPGASAVSDSYGGATFHPFTMPATPGCVAWTDPAEGTTYNCDPVNLIFPGKTYLQVRDRLRAKGWTTWGFGSNQYLHFATATRVRQHIQLWRGDGPGKQYHIRLWQTGTTTLGGVHHETGTWVHTIDMAWDSAEAFVRGQLCTTACSGAFLSRQWGMQDGLDGVADGDTTWRGWGNDAVATVIP
jgi:hypothetical protein